MNKKQSYKYVHVRLNMAKERDQLAWEGYQKLDNPSAFVRKCLAQYAINERNKNAPISDELVRIAKTSWIIDEE